MTTADSLEMNDLQKRQKISELCRLAWDYVCLIVNHEAQPVDRLAAARQAYAASEQAIQIFRQLKGRRPGSASFELSRLALGVVSCVETRLYPRGGTLRTEIAEGFEAEWLLVQLIHVVLYATAFNFGELCELQDRVCALRARAADHLTILQQADLAKRSLRKLDRATAESKAGIVIAALEDVDLLITIAIQDLPRTHRASSAITRITTRGGQRADNSGSAPS